ncbi:unnamed protein product, partial [Trichogramma brassicae]
MDANACSGLWHSKTSRRTRDNEERASKVEEWVFEKGVEILNEPSEVYSFCAHGMSDIDVTVCKGMDEWVLEWVLRDDRGVSDHNPIYVDISVLRPDDSLGCLSGRDWRMCESKNALIAATLRELAEAKGYGEFFGLSVEEKVTCMDYWLRMACEEHLRKGRGKGGRLKWWTEELEKKKKE